MMRRARLPLALLALKPQQQLLPFQYLKYLLHTLAFTVIWNSHLPVVNRRLFAISKIGMPQRVRSCNAFHRVEAQHARDEV